MAQREAPAMPDMEMNAAGQLGAAAKQWQPAAQDVDNIARICHEANRAICVCNKDLSQPAWDDAPEWQKESARKGVLFHVANPYADSKRSHDEWMETKLRNGWRFGPTKDADKKEHPQLAAVSRASGHGESEGRHFQSYR